jgi:Protein of unknown function (DUF3311)
MAAGGAEETRQGGSERPGRSRAVYWLFLLPFAALLYPPLYAHADPHIWGIPFFYWYQAVWLGLTAAISVFIFRRTR